MLRIAAQLTDETKSIFHEIIYQKSLIIITKNKQEL